MREMVRVRDSEMNAIKCNGVQYGTSKQQQQQNTPPNRLCSVNCIAFSLLTVVKGIRNESIMVKQQLYSPHCVHIFILYSMLLLLLLCVWFSISVLR